MRTADRGQGRPAFPFERCDGREVLKVAFLDDFELPGLGQQLPRILANGLQQPVARLALRGLADRDERLVHEAREHVERQPGGDRRRCLRVKAAEENGEGAERRFLVSIEELVAPLDRGPDGRCRDGESRPPPPSAPSRGSRSARISAGVMALIRAAASSIASGSRSSRSQSRTIVASACALGMNSGRRCLARSRKRRYASSASSGSSLQTVSPLTPSDSRLVAKIRTSAHELSRAVASSAHASTTCSQLSSTSSTSRSAKNRPSVCCRPYPRGPRTPSVRAVSAATSGVAGPAVRSTSQTPSGRRAI